MFINSIQNVAYERASFLRSTEYMMEMALSSQTNDIVNGIRERKPKQVITEKVDFAKIKEKIIEVLKKFIEKMKDLQKKIVGLFTKSQATTGNSTDAVANDTITIISIDYDNLSKEVLQVKNHLTKVLKMNVTKNTPVFPVPVEISELNFKMDTNVTKKDVKAFLKVMQVNGDEILTMAQEAAQKLMLTTYSDATYELITTYVKNLNAFVSVIEKSMKYCKRDLEKFGVTVTESFDDDSDFDSLVLTEGVAIPLAVGAAITALLASSIIVAKANRTKLLKILKAYAEVKNLPAPTEFSIRMIVADDLDLIKKTFKNPPSGTTFEERIKDGWYVAMMYDEKIVAIFDVGTDDHPAGHYVVLKDVVKDTMYWDILFAVHLYVTKTNSEYKAIIKKMKEVIEASVVNESVDSDLFIEAEDAYDVKESKIKKIIEKVKATVAFIIEKIKECVSKISSKVKSLKPVKFTYDYDKFLNMVEKDLVTIEQGNEPENIETIKDLSKFKIAGENIKKVSAEVYTNTAKRFAAIASKIGTNTEKLLSKIHKESVVDEAAQYSTIIPQIRQMTSYIISDSYTQGHIQEASEDELDAYIESVLMEEDTEEEEIQRILEATEDLTLDDVMGI